jgi:hypothetical protein
VRVTWRATGALRAGASKPRARCVFIGVVDGATLNLVAAVPVGGQDASVLLRRGGHVERARAELSRHPDGAATVEATVPLGECHLTPGRWSLRLEVVDPGRPTQLYTVDGAFRTGQPPPDPRSGRRYRIRTDPLGAYQLVVEPARTLAEVTRVVVRGTGVRLHGRIVGGGTGPGIATFRSSAGREVSAPVEVSATGFVIVVPIVEMAGPTGQGREETWRVWVRAGGVRRLRLGRYLQDTPNPRATFRADWTTVAIDDRRFVAVRPRYDNAGALLLSTVGFERFAEPAA